MTVSWGVCVQEISPKQKDKGRITLPYIKTVSEPLRRIFASHGISTSFKPTNTLKQLLVAPKDKTPKEEKCGVVYCIPCQGTTRQGTCEESYIGETERSLRTRFLEHKRPSSLSSEVSQHIHIESPGHTVSLDKPAVSSTTSALWAMQGEEGGGPKFQELRNSLVTNNGDTVTLTARGRRSLIKSTRPMRLALHGVRQNFIDNIIPSCRPLQDIQDPKCLPADVTERARFGHDDLQSVLEHVTPGTGTRDHDRHLMMTTHHTGYFPETTKLLNAVAVITMSTVPCKQGFSVQNRIKTKGRVQLKAENLDVLMRISVEGPAIKDFDFYQVLT
ncbi:hypothetical protein Bbelb_032010 [Branchiostoma belcheri]|nr:hypothetical protein Bbelb_032010 [Branchiostoma belcheri]